MDNQEANTLTIDKPFRNRLIYSLAFPIHKRVWRFLMLVLKGWCYFD